jgi:rod shape-determining protein MreD
MTPQARLSLGLALALFLAAVAQATFANALTIRGAQPDFLLAVALLGALFCSGGGGASTGFFAGLLHASLASPPAAGFGSLIVSRTLVCFLVGWLEERIFRDSPLLAVAVVPAGTILAELLFFLFSPQPHVGHWVRVLWQTALYNTVLTLPLYYLVRFFVGPREEGLFSN